MENDKMMALGKDFYDWYRSKKLRLEFGGRDKNLQGEIERVAELIEYVIEKKQLKGK